MARKSTHSVRERHSLTEICAFWSMTIAGCAFLFGGIIRFIVSLIKNISDKTSHTLGQVYHIFTFLGQVALIIAIAIPAYQFVKYKSKSWKVFYWIMLVVFAFGVVLGMLGNALL